MPDSGLTGSRIRQTRLSRGLRQAELAQQVGISPSYLNLIEHNRRRIGGKLLVDISKGLGVDPAVISEGAQSALIEALGTAHTAFPNITSETTRTQEFAGRFPGWATLITTQHDRIQSLEQTVGALMDRLTHDPQLAASMHEMLSVVTAIRSTAAILADGTQLDPEWQVRFQRNLNEDSRRLAEGAQTLVSYLDTTNEGQSASEPSLPKEILENWLAARDFHVAELENNDDRMVETLLENETQLNGSVTIRGFARDYLSRYQADATKVPAQMAVGELERKDCDPLRLAKELGCELATVLRRLACAPSSDMTKTGLVTCDSSGTLTFCKPIEGFGLPKFGAACPLWPLYQSLARPMVPIRTIVEQSGRERARYITFSIAQPVSIPEFAMEPIYEATMLILPEASGHEPAQPVGSSCRICAREHCRGRREPSILTSGF